MLRSITPLLDFYESKKVRIEIEKGDNDQLNVLIQNMMPLDSKEKDEAVQILKPAITSPLILKGTLEQLESGMAAALQQFVQTLTELTTDLQCNLADIQAQADKAKEKAATAASKRGKKPAGKTPFNSGNKSASKATAPKAVASNPAKEAEPEPAEPAQPEVSVDDLF